MNIRIRRRKTDCIVLFSILVSLVMGPVAAGNGLVGNSPFLPEDYEPPREREERRPEPRPRPEPPRGPQPLDQLEFRGLTKFGGELAFSLYDATESRSFWIGVGQSEAGFNVVEYDEGEDAVVVRHDGNTRTVALHESKVQEMPESEARPAQRGSGDRRSSEAEDPEERMQNLAEEIRRRREVRRNLIEEAEAQREGQQSGSQ